MSVIGSNKALLAAAAGVSPGGGWDLANATYNGSPVNFSVIKSRNGDPTSLYFKPDGTKVYYLDDILNYVYENDLSTAWDISTLSYVRFFSVSAQESTAEGLFFKPDGTSMYVVGASGDDINEYSLSTAWDISTASYVQNFSVAAQETGPSGIFFKSDGTKAYVVGYGQDSVHEYSLSTAWDISTASYVQSFSVSAQESNPQDLFFKSDGTIMYVIGSSGDDVNQYTLSTAWDVSTASYVQNFRVATQDGNPNAIFFKDDGTKMYMAGTNIDAIFSYDLSTAWDISTASFTYPTSDYFSISLQESSPSGIFLKSDGTKMYVVGSAGDDVNEYSLSTAWDVITASYVQNFSVAAEETAPQDLFFKPDGTAMYIVGSSGDEVNQYTLSTAWDVSTASYVQNFSVLAQENTPQGLFFKPDGTAMYVVGIGSRAVNEYSLSTAWDISTASYVQNFSVSTQDSSPNSVFFKPDGKIMYMLGDNGDDVNEYSLSTAWDVSTASYVQNFSVSTQAGTPHGMFFKPDGTKMYVVDSNMRVVFGYDL